MYQTGLNQTFKRLLYLSAQRPNFKSLNSYYINVLGLKKHIISCRMITYSYLLQSLKSLCLKDFVSISWNVPCLDFTKQSQSIGINAESGLTYVFILKEKFSGSVFRNRLPKKSSVL